MPASLVILLLSVAALTAVCSIAVIRTSTEPDTSEAPRRWLIRWLRRTPRLAAFARRRVDRTQAGGLLLTVSFIVIFVAALVVGVVFDMVSRKTGLARWDSSAARWGASHSSPASTRFLIGITQLGSTIGVVVASVSYAIYDFRRWRDRRVLLFLVVVVAGQSLLNNSLKWVVQRDRPSINALVHATSSSFPSGHSAAAAATWAALAFLAARHLSGRGRAAVGVAACVIAVMVATSRVLLGVHWLTDVVAGLFLGWGWFTLVAVAFGGRLLRLGQPVEAAGAAAPPAAVVVRRARVLDAVGLCLMAAAVAVVVETLVGWILVLSDGSAAGRADLWVNRWLADHRTSALNHVTFVTSEMGSTGPIVGLALVFSLIFWWRLRSWREPTRMAVTLIMEASSFLIIALLVGRSRPSVQRLESSPATSSFPSGHTAASTVLYVGWALVVARLVTSTRARRMIVVAAIALVTAVALGRLYRGQHHPTDVVAGAMLGAYCLAVVSVVWNHLWPNVDTDSDEEPTPVEIADEPSRRPREEVFT